MRPSSFRLPRLSITINAILMIGFYAIKIDGHMDANVSVDVYDSFEIRYTWKSFNGCFGILRRRDQNKTDEYIVNVNNHMNFVYPQYTRRVDISCKNRSLIVTIKCIDIEDRGMYQWHVIDSNTFVDSGYTLLTVRTPHDNYTAAQAEHRWLLNQCGGYCGYVAKTDNTRAHYNTARYNTAESIMLATVLLHVTGMILYTFSFCKNVLCKRSASSRKANVTKFVLKKTCRMSKSDIVLFVISMCCSLLAIVGIIAMCVYYVSLNHVP